MSNLNDHSDRKSLDLLVDKLLLLKGKSKAIESKTMKQLSVRDYYSPSEKKDAFIVNRTKMKSKKDLRQVKKVKSRIKQNQTANLKNKHEGNGEDKITGWLSKNPSPTKLAETFQDEKKHNIKRKTSCTTNKKPNESYERYGMKVASYEDIVKYQKKSKTNRELIDKMKPIKLAEIQLSPLKFETNDKACSSLLDCESLTPEHIKQKFKQNLHFLKEIFNDLLNNEHHEKFNSLRNDSKCYPSICVFTLEQRQLLISLLHQQFDRKNPLQFSQYYYKVLLPELCFKIFMDVHKMQKKEAENYLKEMYTFF